jgi:hypothetical protein
MESPLSRAGLIEALRASTVLHELLASKKPGKAYAESLYFAGLNAESLKELDPLNLNETYYEACIHQLPNSPTARNCYLRLEGAILSDYSGFDSVPMPQSARDHLAELRKLSVPSEGFWMEWGKGHD